MPDAHQSQQRYRDGIQDLKDAEENTAGHRERCDNVTGCKQARIGERQCAATQWQHNEETHFDERRMIYQMDIQFISFYLFSWQTSTPLQKRREDKKKLPNYENESMSLNIIQAIFL